MLYCIRRDRDFLILLVKRPQQADRLGQSNQCRIHVELNLLLQYPIISSDSWVRFSYRSGKKITHFEIGMIPLLRHIQRRNSGVASWDIHRRNTRKIEPVDVIWYSKRHGVPATVLVLSQSWVISIFAPKARWAIASTAGPSSLIQSNVYLIILYDWSLTSIHSFFSLGNKSDNGWESCIDSDSDSFRNKLFLQFEMRKQRMKNNKYISKVDIEHIPYWVSNENDWKMKTKSQV